MYHNMDLLDKTKTFRIVFILVRKQAGRMYCQIVLKS